ncbi:MAG: helix-turn-helix transcriptional regulator, partial [Acidobacteriota bacterium]
VSTRQIYRWIEADAIQHIKMGPKLARFRRRDIEEWLKERERIGRQ